MRRAIDVAAEFYGVTVNYPMVVKIAETINARGSAIRAEMIAELRRTAGDKRGRAHNAIWAQEGAEEIRAALALERAADRLEALRAGGWGVMCADCVRVVREEAKAAGTFTPTDEQVDYILWEQTPFPFGRPEEHIRPAARKFLRAWRARLRRAKK